MTTDHHENENETPRKPTHRLEFDARERMYKPVKIPQYERGDV